MKIKTHTHFNLNDVSKHTLLKKEKKEPSKKSDSFLENLCKKYGLIFSFKKSRYDRDKLSYTYKYILKNINNDYSLLENIVKHYFVISKLYQFHHPEHHALFFNLFFIKDHLKFVLDCVQILSSFNHKVDWVTLKFTLETQGEEYEELTGYEESFYRKRRTEDDRREVV